MLVLSCLFVTVNGMHESVHAMQCETAATSEQANIQHTVPSDTSPAAPLDSDTDHHDGCDSCVNCACHAPLGVMAFMLGYDPVVAGLSLLEPFSFLPEVHLPKFIPPQNLG